MTKISETLMRPAELAEELSVSLRTIQRWHRQRRGPPRLKIGQQVYFKRESVAGWLADLERGH